MPYYCGGRYTWCVNTDKEEVDMKLAVIVPAYNEEVTIGQMLARLSKIKEVTEVVVVDDHSQDNTVKEVEKVKTNKITVVRVPAMILDSTMPTADKGMT